MSYLAQEGAIISYFSLSLLAYRAVFLVGYIQLIWVLGHCKLGLHTLESKTISWRSVVLACVDKGKENPSVTTLQKGA